MICFNSRRVRLFFLMSIFALLCGTGVYRVAVYVPAAGAAPAGHGVGPVSQSGPLPLVPSFSVPATGTLPLTWPKTENQFIPTTWPPAAIHLAADTSKDVSKDAAKKVTYECYVGGHVKRAGFYSDFPDGGLTVKMMVIAAGYDPEVKDKGYVQVRRLVSPYDSGLMKEIKLKDLFNDPKADMTLHGGEIIIVSAP
jgi:hypothetical protein